MKQSRFSETQIVSILKEADVGLAVKDVCRKHGISQATYYKWKSRYGGISSGSRSWKLRTPVSSAGTRTWRLRTRRCRI